MSNTHANIHAVRADTFHPCLQELDQLGIAGRDVRRELRVLAAQLPSLFDPAVERLRGTEIADAVAHYTAFARHAHPSPAMTEPDGATAFLSTLQDVRAGTVPGPTGGILQSWLVVAAADRVCARQWLCINF